jgi:peptidoglycan DL-endopeptidase CwlO
VREKEPRQVADGSNGPVRILFAFCTATAATLAIVPMVHAEPRPSIDQVERRVGDLYHQAEQATERYNDARIALADAERKLSQLRRLTARTRAEMLQSQKVIAAMAVSAYRSGGVDETLQLLMSDDPDEFLARASALQVLSRQQAESLHKAQVARSEFQADEMAAAQQLAVVEKWRREMSAEKATVERNLRAAQDQLNSLRAAERRRLAERASRERQRASTGETAPRNQEPSPTPAPKVAASGRAANAVRFAYAQLGDRYVWAAAGPDAWDCSGLTMMAWKAAGVSLPHSSRLQYSSGTRVSRSQLRPGDLVFFYSPISHVGIYIGGGNMIHAPNPSSRVEISPISEMPYAGATRP